MVTFLFVPIAWKLLIQRINWIADTTYVINALLSKLRINYRDIEEAIGKNIIARCKIDNKELNLTFLNTTNRETLELYNNHVIELMHYPEKIMNT